MILLNIGLIQDIFNPYIFSILFAFESLDILNSSSFNIKFFGNIF